MQPFDNYVLRQNNHFNYIHADQPNHKLPTRPRYLQV